MSRLTELLSQLKSKDSQLGIELEKEFRALSSRREFGLNFERHRPESVELPKRIVRKGDKVRVLPERGSTKKGDQRLWKVKTLDGKNKIAQLELLNCRDVEMQEVSTSDLIVVAEFQDYIYPGLVSTGKVEKNPNKPFHTVINGENYHVLKALTFTHKGKFDAIYIDPPYNTGARDWKYNNDYVESDDLYRHSKWLAFIERRLKVAGELINKRNSVLIVTIDEKEVHRLRMLLEQIFPEANVQMITTVISQNGTSRDGEFSRVEEYIMIARFGDSKILRTNDNMLAQEGEGKVSRVWFNFMRTSTPREKTEGQFYPIFINENKGTIVEIGKKVGKGNPVPVYQENPEFQAILPIRDDNGYASWGAIPETAQWLHQNGYLRLGKKSKKTGFWSIQYVREGDRKRIESGSIVVNGKEKDGSLILEHVNVDNRETFPKTVWNRKSHDATAHGTRLNKSLIPGRNFPYPKSMYAVEDTLRFFIGNNKNALVLDFFSGSGTTAHAVMRLNKQDGGNRQSVSVTNNEVSSDEHKRLKKEGLRPGDEQWEQLGICDYITKPRIKAAITGLTPDGSKIADDYKFRDEFPMSDGFDENAEFFTLTYENPISINHNLAFSHIAPLLWMKAGSYEERIESIPKNGWRIAGSYGLLVDLDKSSDFIKGVHSSNTIKTIFIVTNDDRRFQSIVRHLSEAIEPVRLYESYLKNFQFTAE